MTRAALDAGHVIKIITSFFSCNNQWPPTWNRKEVNRGIRHFRIVFLDILKQLIRLTCFGS